MHLRLIGLVLLMVLPALAMAQDGSHSAYDPEQIFDASAGALVIEDISLQTGDALTIEDILMSNDDELARLRDRIHTAYEITAEGMNDSDRKAFRTSQANWSEFAQSACEAEQMMAEGKPPSEPLVVCQVRQAKQRLDWLNDVDGP